MSCVQVLFITYPILKEQSPTQPEKTAMDIKYNAVIAFHLSGKRQKDIVSELQHLNIQRNFVYRTIKRYNETGSTNKRNNSGPKRTARTTAMISKLKKRLQRNTRRSARKLAKDLNVSDWSIWSILKNDLRTKPFKIQKVQDLTLAQKDVRLQRAKLLKSLAARNEIPNIVFSDEKIFTTQQYANKQNDRVWLQGKSEDNLNTRVATRKQGPASVMVWAAISANGRSPLVFIDKGVKMNQSVYRDQVLNEALLPWAHKMFSSSAWTFQQDSAPSHKARATQEYLTERVPRLISAQEWPLYSPDLNPMDFSIWSILEAKVCAKKHQTLGSLKASLQRAWAALNQNVVRSACNAFHGRLNDVIKAKGGHIEQ